MTKILINNNDEKLKYPVKADSLANINNILDEWIRFTSYFKPEEVLFLNNLDKKTLIQLTSEEMEEYQRITKQKAVSEMFIKYKNKNCSKEEHDQVISYMNMPLKSFMQDRLTEEELKQSTFLLAKFKKMSKSELDDYIESQMKKYDSLTIFEAYILYEIKEIKYNKVTGEVTKKIANEQITRGQNLKISLRRDYGPRGW